MMGKLALETQFVLIIKCNLLFIIRRPIIPSDSSVVEGRAYSCEHSGLHPDQGEPILLV